MILPIVISVFILAVIVIMFFTFFVDHIWHRIYAGNYIYSDSEVLTSEEFSWEVVKTASFNQLLVKSAYKIELRAVYP